MFYKIVISLAYQCMKTCDFTADCYKIENDTDCFVMKSQNNEIRSLVAVEFTFNENRSDVLTYMLPSHVELQVLENATSLYLEESQISLQKYLDLVFYPLYTPTSLEYQSKFVLDLGQTTTAYHSFCFNLIDKEGLKQTVNSRDAFNYSFSNETIIELAVVCF